MMKRALITLSLIFSTFIAFAQNFEGKVVYHNSYKSKSPTLTDAQLTRIMGDTQNWYIKNGEYKSDVNGIYIKWQLYANAENKLYTKLGNTDTVYYNDAAQGESEIRNIQLNKNVADILGYKCDELILTTKSGTQRYYFSSKLPINSKLFLNHKFGDWYAYLIKANAVPLKTIIDTPQFALESVATEITPMKLEQSFFTLPAGTKTSKNPIN
jgi:hypothetical protein